MIEHAYDRKNAILCDQTTIAYESSKNATNLSSLYSIVGLLRSTN